MVLRVIFFSLITFSKISFSSDNYQRVMNNCLKRKDWEKVKCNLSELPDEVGYQENKINTFSLNFASSLFELFDEVWDLANSPMYIPYIINDEEELTLDRPELKKDAYIKVLLQFHKENQELNGCQRACVVKCVTSNILDFSMGVSETKLGAVEDSLELELGQCTEFSRVANFVGRHIGVQTELVGSPTHAFVGFKINGERYFTEPQEVGCNFFTPEKHEQAEIDKLESNLNQKNRYQQMYDSQGLYEGWQEAPPIYSRPR